LARPGPKKERSRPGRPTGRSVARCCPRFTPPPPPQSPVRVYLREHDISKLGSMFLGLAPRRRGPPTLSYRDPIVTRAGRHVGGEDEVMDEAAGEVRAVVAELAVAERMRCRRRQSGRALPRARARRRAEDGGWARAQAEPPRGGMPRSEA